MEIEASALLTPNESDGSRQTGPTIISKPVKYGISGALGLLTIWGMFQAAMQGYDSTPDRAFARNLDYLSRADQLSPELASHLQIRNTILVPSLQPVPSIFDTQGMVVFSGTWKHPNEDQINRRLLPSEIGGPMEVTFEKVGPNNRPVAKIALWNQKYIDQPRIFLTVNMAFSRLSAPNTLILVAWSGLEYFVAAEHHPSAFSRSNYTDFELQLRMELLTISGQPISFAELNRTKLDDVRLKIEVASPFSLTFSVQALLSPGAEQSPSVFASTIFPLLMIMFGLFFWGNTIALMTELMQPQFAQQVGMIPLTMWLLLYLHYILYHSALLPQYKGFLMVSHLIVLIFQLLGLAFLWAGFLAANDANWGLGITNRIATFFFLGFYVMTVGQARKYFQDPSVYHPFLRWFTAYPLVQVLSTTFIQPPIASPTYSGAYHFHFYLNMAVFGALFNATDNSYFKMMPIPGMFLWIATCAVLGSAFVFLQKKLGTYFAFPCWSR